MAVDEQNTTMRDWQAEETLCAGALKCDRTWHIGDLKSIQNGWLRSRAEGAGWIDMGFLSTVSIRSSHFECVLHRSLLYIEGVFWQGV